MTNGNASNTQTTSGLAIASLVCGLSTVFCLITAVPGLICGILALVQIGGSQGRIKGKGLAISGIAASLVLMIVPVMLTMAIMLPALARAREAARRASCQNNLKQMGIVFKMVSMESKGQLYPELSPEAGRLMCLTESIYPEYLTDAEVLLCPSEGQAPGMGTAQSEEAVDDHSYVYLGYVITNDDEMEAFAEVYRQRIAAGLPFDEDLPAPPGRGSFGSDTFYRLREDVGAAIAKEMGMTGNAAALEAQIPVMWDKTDVTQSGGSMTVHFSHVPNGANVAYLNGHVTFVRYGEAWPVTERACAALAEMDTLGNQ